MWFNELLLVLFICNILMSNNFLLASSKQDSNYNLDEFFWSKHSSIGQVERLLREYRRNEDLVKNIGANFYQIIYPVQLRRHEKMGISTRDAGTAKVRLKRNSSTYYRGHEHEKSSNFQSRNRSKGKKHFHRTSILIKAFNHLFRLDLELNTQLLSVNLIQKHFAHNGAEQFIKQEIEHCYYHGTVKDYPGATAAFHTCNGVSGIIQVGNETFVIHPFYGGDMSKHPHVIFEARTKINKGCANSNNMEWRPSKNNRKPKHISENLQDDISLKFSNSARTIRDIKDSTKFIELALVIDKAMFEKRNGSSRIEVIHDAIQVANIADLYFKSLNTRLSVVYIESWQSNNQITIDRSQDISRTLLNFNDYTSRKLFKIEKDTTQLLTGEEFEGAEAGMAVQNSICTAKSVGVSVDVNPYELHLLAGSLAHMIGHNVGMSHDDNREECFCRDWHGCIMTQSIVGLENVQPYKFSECSRFDYIDTLKVGHGICLLNKPSEIDNRRLCGNGIVEDNEDCDCGSYDDCSKKDPCCDPLTCKFHRESECSSGPCCFNCKLKRKGELCRKAINDCDLPEFCDGENGQCSIDLHKKNGTPCNSNTGHCFNGECPNHNLQCAAIWGDGGIAADEKCFEQFNSKGSVNGHCGITSNNQYIKCASENVQCGTLQCQLGNRTPMIKELNQMFSRTIISIQGFEYECKSLGGIGDQKKYLNTILVKDGTPCGQSSICINQSCVNLFPHIKPLMCPSSFRNVECSGHGVCSNLYKCYCDPGWGSIDCSIQTDEAPYSIDSSTTNSNFNYLATISPANSNDSGANSNSAGANFTLIMQKKETPYGEGNSNSLSTLQMVFILVGVVKGVFICFALVALCYRKSGSNSNKYDSSSIYEDEERENGSRKVSNTNSNDGSIHSSNKVLSATNIPSYCRTDSQRVLFRPNQVQQNNSFNQKYYSDQNMHKLNRFKEPITSEELEAMELCEDEIVSFIDLPHGKMNEKRGILKKQDSGYGLVCDMAAENCNNQTNLLSNANEYSPIKNTSTMSQVEKTLKSLNGYHEDIIEALRSAATTNHEPTPTSSMNNENLTGEELLRKSLQDFRLHEFNKRPSCRSTSQDKVYELQQTYSLMKDSTTHLSRLSSPQRLFYYTNDEHEPLGPLRIRNLEDLISQLDEQPQFVHDNIPDSNEIEEIRLNEIETDPNHYRLDSSSICSDLSQQSQQRFRPRLNENQKYVLSGLKQLNDRNVYYQHSRQHTNNSNIYQNTNISDKINHDDTSESSTTVSPLVE